jgi:methyl coenzyme M reductase gamma subunit
MKNILAVLLFSVSSLAVANNCPNEMKAIDAKLQSASGISAEDMAKIKALRAEGEKYHKEGKHAESMKSLQEAKKMLRM